MIWTSRTTYVDVATGEAITKAHAEKKYDKISKTIEHETRNNTYGIKKIIWHCERKRQQTIWE